MRSKVLEPATRGTVNVLRSCIRAGTIQWVVFTSSVSTLAPATTTGGADEAVVNESCLRDLGDVWATKPIGWIYVLSKRLTEEAALRFAWQNGIRLVSVVLPLIAGPFLTQTVPTSVLLVLSAVTRNPKLCALLASVHARFGCVPLAHIQDDPLSPFLFILAIDAAVNHGEGRQPRGSLPFAGQRTTTPRQFICGRCNCVCKPRRRRSQEPAADHGHVFGGPTGLQMNPNKSSVAPIRCQNTNLGTVLQGFNRKIAVFPLTYLGLPITLGRLKKVHLQFVFDRIKAKLAGWKGRLMNHAGQRALVRSVLSAIPTFALTAIRAPKGFYIDVDKICRRFLWAQEEQLSGGKCKVNWGSVCTPVNYGGLGIHDMEKFARALRLRWLWLTWTAPNRPWIGSELPCDERDRDLFATATSVRIGNGEQAQFWESSWIGHSPLRCIAPTLFSICRKKNRSVREALANHQWISDINRQQPPSDRAISEFLLIWNLIRGAEISLQPDIPDEIIWKTSSSGTYSTAAAYRMQFLGRTTSPFTGERIGMVD